MKKIAEILFYACVPKTTIIWGTVPEIPSETGKYVVLLSNFLPFDSPNNSENRRCHHFTRVPKITIIWCMLPEIWSVTVTTFCPFTPLLTPWKSKFGKNVKTPGDIIFYHMCTINHDHMKYGSWDIRHNGHSFFIILGHLLPFDRPNNLQNQNFEKIKKNIVHTGVSNTQFKIIFPPLLRSPSIS